METSELIMISLAFGVLSSMYAQILSLKSLQRSTRSWRTLILNRNTAAPAYLNNITLDLPSFDSCASAAHCAIIHMVPWIHPNHISRFREPCIRNLPSRLGRRHLHTSPLKFKLFFSTSAPFPHFFLKETWTPITLIRRSLS